MLRHLFLFVGYGGLATAAAFYLPIWLPAMDWMLATVSASVLFLIGALLHESYSRVGRETSLTEQLLRQRRSLADLEDELTWTRREVRAVREALEAVARAGKEGGGTAAMGEVMAEVKMLKSLVGRLADASAQAARRDGKQAGPAPSLRADPDGKPALRGIPRAVKAAKGLAAKNEPALLDKVREALRDDQIELLLQPIVSLPQRKHRGYECFSRLTAADGTKLEPAQYIEVAEKAGLIAAIDNMLLFRCIQLVRRIQRKNQSIDFFCNLSPHTLADQTFFGDFVDFLESNPELAQNLVFEFSQDDLAQHDKDAHHHLERLHKLGCRYSLDQVKNIAIDAEQLAMRHVRFVKLDIVMVLSHLTGDALVDLRAFKAKLDEKKIDLIVEKVENEDDVVELLDLGIDYGQGFLFGEPRNARSSEAA